VQESDVQSVSKTEIIFWSQMGTSPQSFVHSGRLLFFLQFSRSEGTGYRNKVFIVENVTTDNKFENQMIIREDLFGQDFREKQVQVLRVACKFKIEVSRIHSILTLKSSTSGATGAVTALSKQKASAGGSRAGRERGGSGSESSPAPA